MPSNLFDHAIVFYQRIKSFRFNDLKDGTKEIYDGAMTLDLLFVMDSHFSHNENLMLLKKETLVSLKDETHFVDRSIVLYFDDFYDEEKSSTLADSLGSMIETDKKLKRPPLSCFFLTSDVYITKRGSFIYETEFTPDNADVDFESNDDTLTLQQNEKSFIITFLDSASMELAYSILMKIKDSSYGTAPNWLNNQLKLRKKHYTYLKEIIIRIGTFNIHGKIPSEDNLNESFLDDWIKPKNNAESADIFIFGFQEVNLASNHFLSYAPTNKAILWINFITERLESLLKDNYEIVEWKLFSGLLILFYATPSTLMHIKSIDYDFIGCGLFGLGGKGAIGLRVNFDNMSTACFINVHLAAHEGSLSKRNDSFIQINRRLFPLAQQVPNVNMESIHDSVEFQEHLNYYYSEVCNNKNVLPRVHNGITDPFQKSSGFLDDTLLDRHHAVFLFGDLNYRITSTDINAGSVWDLYYSSDFKSLIQFDQLMGQMNSHPVFSKYVEFQGVSEFPPTYKYEPGSNIVSLKRVPSYCDRILYYLQAADPFIKIREIDYNSCHSVTLSDHKPVYTTFGVQLPLIDYEIYRKIKLQLLQHLDKIENEKIPSLSIDPVSITLRKKLGVSDKNQHHEEVSIHLSNTGIASVHYSAKIFTKSDLNLKYFIMIKNGDESGILSSHQRASLTIRVKNEFWNLKRTCYDIVEAIVILSVDNGKDYFLPINLDYIESYYGKDLCTVPFKAIPENMEFCILKDSHSFDILPAGLKLPWPMAHCLELLVKISERSVLQSGLFLKKDTDKAAQLRDLIDLEALSFDLLDALKCIDDTYAVAICQTMIDFLYYLPAPLVHKEACIDFIKYGRLSIEHLIQCIEMLSPHCQSLLVMMAWLSRQLILITMEYEIEQYLNEMVQLLTPLIFETRGSDISELEEILKLIILNGNLTRALPL